MFRRTDTRELYDALDRERSRRGISWSQLAGCLGASPPAVRHLAEGGRTTIALLTAAAGWLEVPIATLTREVPRTSPAAR